MDNIKQIIVIGLTIFALGYYLGGKYQSPKEITKVEVQEHEVIKNNIITVTKEITKADGTKETVTTVVDKSIEKKDKQVESIVSKTIQKQWLVGLGVNPFSYTDTYSAQINRRVLGPFSVGVQYIRNKSENIGLTNIMMEF